MIYDKMTQRAYDMALLAHNHQKDKMGRPYMNHVLAVAREMHTPELTCIALLHDVLEDSDIFTIEDIYKNFDSDIAFAVNLLTRREGEPYMQYIENLADNGFARIVKMADLKANCEAEGCDDLKYDRYFPALLLLSLYD